MIALVMIGTRSCERIVAGATPTRAPRSARRRPPRIRSQHPASLCPSHPPTLPRRPIGRRPTCPLPSSLLARHLPSPTNGVPLVTAHPQDSPPTSSGRSRAQPHPLGKRSAHSRGSLHPRTLPVPGRARGRDVACSHSKADRATDELRGRVTGAAGGGRSLWWVVMLRSLMSCGR